jgi:hypothetical protein
LQRNCRYSDPRALPGSAEILYVASMCYELSKLNWKAGIKN